MINVSFILSRVCPSLGVTSHRAREPLSHLILALVLVVGCLRWQWSRRHYRYRSSIPRVKVSMSLHHSQGTKVRRWDQRRPESWHQIVSLEHHGPWWHAAVQAVGRCTSSLHLLCPKNCAEQMAKSMLVDIAMKCINIIEDWQAVALSVNSYQYYKWNLDEWYFVLTASLPKDWETSSDGSWMLHHPLHRNVQSPFKSCRSLNKREPPGPAKLTWEGRDAPLCPLIHWKFYTGANCLRGCWSLTQICSPFSPKKEECTDYTSPPTLVYREHTGSKSTLLDIDALLPRYKISHKFQTGRAKSGHVRAHSQL